MKKIKLRSPATVANLSCGYDILGLCLEKPYDEIEIVKIPEKKIEIDILKSAYSNIPSNPKENTGGIPALLIQNDLNLDFGFKISINKGIPLSGGLGSSAATAAGVAYGINKLLGDKFSVEEVAKYALEGEKITVSTPHADNIGPCLLGGLVLIKETNPLDLIRLPISKFYISILHPDIIINTKRAREILPKKISLTNAVKQWGNISALTYGFCINDKDLIQRSMKDIIVEPVRSKLINGFDIIKKNVLENGAIGCSISGSGPSIFAISESEKNAQYITSVMEKTAKSLSLSYDSYTSPVNYTGPIII